MSLPIRTTAGNGPKSKRGLEIYATPPCAVEALVAAEPLPLVCWEACGPETSANASVLCAHGRRVVCTDISIDGVDFRGRRCAPSDAQAIVANPPSGLDTTPEDILAEWEGRRPELEERRNKAIERLQNEREEEPKADTSGPELGH